MLDAGGHPAAALPDSLDRAAEAPRDRPADRHLVLALRASRRFRVNVFFQRDAVGAAFRLIPHKIRSLEELGLPAGPAEAHRATARPRARHRTDRLGEVDDAGGDDRRDQPDPRGAHPDDRGSDRVPPPPPQVPRQPARDRQRRERVCRSSARRAPPGPRRDPARRDAGPRDDLHRADGCGDRAPRLCDAAHARRGGDDRPHHRRLSRRSSRLRSARSSPRRSRVSSRRRCCPQPTAGAGSPRWRSCCPTTRCGT